jgi:2-polyprenyl-6-methoxyphenol hydroxylase-like FAD-dependent oxidoreductase
VVRVLIVGAGVAGLALAGRLAQQGRDVLVVERDTDRSGGYAIGLYPLGSCVLHGLGLYDDFLGAGQVVGTYRMADGAGRPMQTIDMQVLTDGVGPMVMIDRAELLALLERAATVTIRRGTTVASLQQDAHGVDVTFDDGRQARFDLVVGCDGIGSATRERIMGPQPGFDAGWLLWTWWADAARFEVDAVREHWGRGWFFGAYPSPGHVMCAAGGPASWGDPTEQGAAGAAAEVAALLRARLRPLVDRDPAVAGAVDDLDLAHRWPMRDVRSARWCEGRVVLCGDSAVAFLPTAGVGASNALRAAAALADELSRADAASVPLALELYEQRCRRVIERNQTDSRRLARALFVGNPALGWVRDQVARRTSPERALGQIIASVHQPF